jgi:hypothetical protein
VCLRHVKHVERGAVSGGQSRRSVCSGTVATDSECVLIATDSVSIRTAGATGPQRPPAHDTADKARVYR